MAGTIFPDRRATDQGCSTGTQSGQRPISASFGRKDKYLRKAREHALEKGIDQFWNYGTFGLQIPIGAYWTKKHIVESDAVCASPESAGGRRV
jgi:hypothetical protein